MVWQAKRVHDTDSRIKSKIFKTIEITSMKLIYIAFYLLITSLSAAVSQPIKLEYVRIFDNTRVKLPSDFVPISDDDLALKYPSTKKPLAMYTSADRNADFGVNVSKTVWPENDLKILQKVYRSTILEMYQKVTFTKDEITTIDNKQFIAFEFTSEVENHKKYTYVLYKILKNHVYIFNFTCAQRVMEKWKPIAPEIISSLRFNLNNPEEIARPRKDSVKYYKPKRKLPTTAK